MLGVHISRFPARFPICAFSLGVKWSYAPCLEVRVGVFPPAVPFTTCFTLLAAVMVEAGAAVDREHNDFGVGAITGDAPGCRDEPILD